MTTAYSFTQNVLVHFACRAFSHNFTPAAQGAQAAQGPIRIERIVHAGTE